MARFLKSGIFLLVPGLLFAQITVESITTDTIDLFSSARDPSEQRSTGAAMALSLLVPGIGHQYIDRPDAGLAYLTADIMSIVGLIFFERYSRQLDLNSRGLAAANAGVQGNVSSERFWQMVGSFQSMNSYNTEAGLARADKEIYKDEKHYWYWNSDEAKDQYNQMRDNSRKLHIISSFCIGAMVLNRVIAFVDVRAATRFRTTQLGKSFSVHPFLQNPGLKISAEF